MKKKYELFQKHVLITQDSKKVSENEFTNDLSVIGHNQTCQFYSFVETFFYLLVQL